LSIRDGESKPSHTRTHGFSLICQDLPIQVSSSTLF
jgi:hypothetical protein